MSDQKQEAQAGADSAVARPIFDFFNEIAIIAQLSRARFEKRLPEGLNVPQFSVLNHLARLGDGRTPLALARAFQTPKTSMTHTLSVLEARGYIAMAPNPADGRGKIVRLTAEGAAFREAAIASLTPDAADLLSAFDAADIAALTERLRAVRAFLDANRTD